VQDGGYDTDVVVVMMMMMMMMMIPRHCDHAGVCERVTPVKNVPTTYNGNVPHPPRGGGRSLRGSHSKLRA
jgi:hypothetical protein